jgi:hypothetical protein
MPIKAVQGKVLLLLLHGIFVLAAPQTRTALPVLWHVLSRLHDGVLHTFSVKVKTDVT